MHNSKMKSEKLTIKEKVYQLLKKKKVALTKSRIASYLYLKDNSVNYALKKLRKEKKVGNIKQYAHCWPSYIEKSYWGVK